MNRIDARTVEFNYSELRVKERFEELLDDGLGIPAAARQALTEGQARNRPGQRSYSAAFVEYLSDDTVMVTRRGKVILTGFGRSLTS